jgi:hypothetical protein
MTTDIVTVTPDTGVQACMNIMESRQIRRVLVVDKNGKCVGIVAQADLVEHLTHSDQTAHFVREVSESENDRKYESRRPEFDERRNHERNNELNLQNQSVRRFQGKHSKSSVEKESFFNSKTILTLLGSLGLGVGLKYYLGQKDEKKYTQTAGRKVKTYNRETENKIGKSSSDLSIKTPSRSTTDVTKSSVTPVAHNTENKDKLGGSINSFNKTNDDPDLKPIIEVGRTADNS